MRSQSTISSESVAIGTRSLTIEEIDAIARGQAAARIPLEVRSRIVRSHQFARRVIEQCRPVYGLTTGCGPLAAHEVSADQRVAFQRNLIRSHAVTLGNPLSVRFVRAAMASRAHVLALGHSGVDPATVELLVTMLNEGVHPIVRDVGGVGASGDLVELAQIALAAIGEGEVEHKGRIVPAAEALRAAGANPLVPVYREGLALINGTSCHTGGAAVLLARTARIISGAQIAAAMLFEALRGRIEAFDPALQTARPHAGQRAVAGSVLRLLTGSKLVRTDDVSAGTQDAYTLRSIAQVLGAVLDTVETTKRTVEVELNSVSDNPLFLPDESRVVHGGNFHGQPVAMALDQLKMSMVELAVMSERRIARVLDPKLSLDLPAFLIRNGAGVQSGFMGLQYCASSMVAENAVLAAPASVHSVPTNANNQDIVSMGMVAARQAARVIDNVERMIAIELLCAAQALDLREPDNAGRGTHAAYTLIRTRTAPLLEDRPLAADVEAMQRLIEDGTLALAVRAATA